MGVLSQVHRFSRPVVWAASAPTPHDGWVRTAGEGGGRAGVVATTQHQRGVQNVHTTDGKEAEIATERPGRDEKRREFTGKGKGSEGKGSKSAVDVRIFKRRLWHKCADRVGWVGSDVWGGGVNEFPPTAYLPSRSSLGLLTSSRWSNVAQMC